MINVTKTYLPSKEKYQKYIDEIFESGQVTNNGPMVKRLEKRLADYLGVKNIVLVANGTMALGIAYKLLRLEGEVITTPFSFVATASSLAYGGLKPAFADIDSETFNLDPKNIEAAITEQTSGIVPVHIFGNACEVEEIESIAKKHNLKVIYDAAHTFDTQYKGESLLNQGDISILSFHATKLFHTIEGGALIIEDDALAREARLLINFGIDGPDSVIALGINAKMNEFEAAMGLCVLDDIDIVLDHQRGVFERYESGLKDVVSFQKQNKHSTQNYRYFPILLKTENETLRIQKALNDAGVFPRRYFYPSLDTLPYVEASSVMPLSRDISSRILVLPSYYSLTKDQQTLIMDIVRGANRDDAFSGL